MIENGEIIFCRDIPAGGLTYTTEIHKAMGMSLEEAEALKISACTGREAPEEVTRILQSTHEVMAEEVQSSLDFFVNTTPGLPVQQCFVTGGASRTLGLLPFISKHTKLACEGLDPFRNVRLGGSMSTDYVAEIRDFASIALGLGMRSPGDG